MANLMGRFGSLYFCNGTSNLKSTVTKDVAPNLHAYFETTTVLQSFYQTDCVMYLFEMQNTLWAPAWEIYCVWSKLW